MIAIGYIRRSKKSEEHNVSLDEQRRHITEFCAGAGLTLDHVISHDGVSGTKRKRFPVIRKAIKDYNARAVVVYNLDRLARDNAGLIEEFQLYRKTGVALYESTSGLIGDGALDQLMLQIRGALDEFFAKVTGQKTAGALKLLKSQGRKYTRIPPFGYAYIDGRMVLNEEEFRVLGQIAHFKLEGLTAAKIETSIRATGYMGRLSVRTIQRMTRVPLQGLHA